MGSFNHPLSALLIGSEDQPKVHETTLLGFMHGTELGIEEGGMERKGTQFKMLGSSKGQLPPKKKQARSHTQAMHSMPPDLSE